MIQCLINQYQGILKSCYQPALGFLTFVFFYLRFSLWFTFASEMVENSQTSESLEKVQKTFPGTLSTTAMLTVFFKKSFKNQNKGRIKKGEKTVVPLIATNVYRARFKKSLENEK